MRILRRLRSVPPLLAAGLLAGVLVPGAPAGAVVSYVPYSPVSAFGATPVAHPENGVLNRTEPQSLSGDGRAIAFVTPASGPGDAGGGADDVYVRDRRTGTTELVSRPTTGAAVPGKSWSPSISSDGRFVAFLSIANLLVPGDTADDVDVFVRDRTLGTTTRVGRTPSGALTPGTPYLTQISADGKVVMWWGDGGIYLRPVAPLGTIKQIAPGAGVDAALSGDGAYVAWIDTTLDGLVRRTRVSDLAVTEISVGTTGVRQQGYNPTISADGRIVGYVSSARDLVDPPTNGGPEAFIWVEGQRTYPVGDSAVRALTMSATGHVAYATDTSLSPNDIDTGTDIYVGEHPGSRLLSDALPPSPRSPGRTPWFPEISGDGQVVTIVSGEPGSPRRWAVSTLARSDAQYRSWVADYFADLFARAATAAELDARVAKLRAGTYTLPELIVEDVDRASYSDLRAGVVRLYEAYFRRPPDLGGYDFWVARRRAGQTIQDISRSFAASGEFRTLYGALTNRQFVNLVYTNVLGRPADAAGSDFWTDQLDRGARNRGQVMVIFSESAENRARTRNRVVHTMLRRSLDDAVPTAAELASWEARWRVGVPLTAAVMEIWD